MKCTKKMVIAFAVFIAIATIGLKVNALSRGVFNFFKDKTFTSEGFKKAVKFNADEDVFYLPQIDNSNISDSIDNLSVLRNKEVRKFLYLYLTKNRAYIIDSIERSYLYRKTIMKEFENEEGIPEYITLLPLLESGFCPRAVSRSKAVGLWQFMKGTSSILGLEKNRWIDERRSVKKSTKAALTHLKNLHGIFKSWDLALAAYNSGSVPVYKAMKETGAKNIWQLITNRSLRRETHEYVPRFIALVLIYKYQREFGIKREINKPKVIDIAEIDLKEQVNIKDISKISNTSVKTLKLLNPELNKFTTPPGKKGYSLKIPDDAKNRLLENNRIYLKMFTLL